MVTFFVHGRTYNIREGDSVHFVDEQIEFISQGEFPIITRINGRHVHYGHSQGTRFTEAQFTMFCTVILLARNDLRLVEVPYPKRNKMWMLVKK